MSQVRSVPSSRSRSGHPGRAERGATLIIVAILGLLLIGIVGIAMDASYVLTAEQQLQRAADASSLAAARLVKFEADPFNTTNPFTATRDAAVDIALQNVAAASAVAVDRNDANAADGDVVIGIWDPDAETFTPDLLTPNAVRVRARRTEALHGPVSLLFGPVFGTNVANVVTTATAVLAPAQQALILILDPHMSGALKLNGTVLMTVAGKVHVNSDHQCGVLLNGQPFKVQAIQTSVVGEACYQDGTIAGAVIEHADIEEDPLADVLPTTADWNTFKAGLTTQPGSDGLGAIKVAGTYPPGYYPGGINVASGEVVVLDPSANPSNPYFMFGGGGITLHGSSFMTGQNVTVFLDKNAKVDISGSGAGASLKATDSGTFEGIAFFHHRENGKDVQSKITGGGLFQVEGLIYVPGGELVMGGNPGKEIGAIIVNSLSNAGVTGFTITGKGIPPSEGEEYTYLVE